MKTLKEKLQQYLDSTPQILRDWESTSKYGQVGQEINEFLEKTTIADLLALQGEKESYIPTKTTDCKVISIEQWRRNELYKRILNR